MPVGVYERDENYRRMMSLATKGIRRTPEQRHRIALSKMGDLNPSKRLDVRKKISEALRGIPRPESSKRLKHYYLTHRSQFYGKHHTEEAKEILSAKLKNNTNGRRLEWPEPMQMILNKSNFTNDSDYRKEYQKQWRTMNSSHLAKHAREYRITHDTDLKIQRRSYVLKHKTELATRQKQRYFELRYIALTTYSGEGALWPRCVCCGEERFAFLTIDHINGGGTKHSKEYGRDINTWLYLHGYPDGFRTLCYNCNCGRGRRGRINTICPHELGLN